ncbi:MAG: hypothetical protein CM1200mP10_20950 [Candidatus Neomarinimicrobiota bacterium]|nr:MAG: hypothetical protein CM1200mP10_20950 [Candidatus Neomarinimicrobiota bacterium]
MKSSHLMISRPRNYESGATMGVFYIESPATRQLLIKAGKVDFDT